MAELTSGVMFQMDNAQGYTEDEVTAFNFELMDVLGDLDPGSDTYMQRAKTFHDEVARR